MIFVRPRHVYDSYQDLYRLIELSDYPLIHFDELDPASNNIYILTIVNGENEHGWKGVRARIILYDLEWRLEGTYPRIPGVSEVWAADKWYAEQIVAKYVPMGSHADLPVKPLVSREKVWDVSILSYLTYRRMHIKGQLEDAGITISPQGWQDRRHDVLEQTRLMLAVHQRDDAPTIAPQRWALTAAYRMPMLCETVHDSGIFASQYAIYAPYPDIVQMVRKYKDETNILNDYADALHDLLCNKYPFRKCIEAAL